MASSGYMAQAPMYQGQPEQHAMATPYGTVAYDEGGLSKSWVADMAGANSKGMFMLGRRRRMNFQPLLLCVLVPWLIFCTVYCSLAFQIHYEEPGLCWLVVALALAAVAVAGTFACTSCGRLYVDADHEPTWYIFVFLTMLLAFIVGFVLGSANFGGTMQSYYDMRSLRDISDVSPARMHGQQLMDAGVVQFVPGTRLDLSKSSGFKSGKMYCVAPVTVGDVELVTYDFWMVGTDCCSGVQGNFHCKDFNNPHANGGLRLLSDADRGFYRLAVQQAEATHNIKASHPLFFEWSVDPIATVDGWKIAGRSSCIVWLTSYLIFQIFLVAVATVAFAKLGFS